MALKQRRENLLWLHSDLDDAGLDPFTFRIYAHLARRAESTGRAWPKVADIAEACKISPRMVGECLKKLVDERLIVIVGGLGANGGGKRNVYHLVARNEWLTAKMADQATEQSAPHADCKPSETGEQTAPHADCNRHLMPIDYIGKGYPSKGYPIGEAPSASLESSEGSIGENPQEGTAKGSKASPATRDSAPTPAKPAKATPSAKKKGKGKAPDPKTFLADFPIEFRQSDEFVEAWVRWCESRVERGKDPVTRQAATIARNKLIKFPIDHGVRSLDLSTLSGWTAVFPESLNSRQGEADFKNASGNASDQDFGLGGGNP